MTQTLLDDVAVVAHHQRPAIAREHQREDHRRVRGVQVQQVGLGIAEQPRQVGAVVDLAKTRRAPDAHDLDRPILFNTSRPAPLVVHADDSYPAAQHRLRLSQGPDRSLDAAVGRVEKFAQMGDPQRRPVRSRGRLTRPKVVGNVAGDVQMSFRGCPGRRKIVMLTCPSESVVGCQLSVAS